MKKLFTLIFMIGFIVSGVTGCQIDNGETVPDENYKVEDTEDSYEDIELIMYDEL